MSFINSSKKMFEIISGKKYRKCPEGSLTHNAERRALNAGLINSEQIMAYCDNYTTGLPCETITEALSSYWDITSPQEATETLEFLSQYGHRFIYEIVLKTYSEDASEDDPEKVLAALLESGRYGHPETVLEDMLAEEPSDQTDLIYQHLARAMDMLENLQSIFGALKDEVNGLYLPRDYDAGILAWDLGRLVTVARLSLDCGYIEQSELSRVLAHVDTELNANFSSWPQFAKSYIIGRAAWSGQTMSLGGIIGITEDLMTNKDSPWVLFPL
jgi:hypothetical protein